MFKCPLTYKINSVAMKSPKTRNFQMTTCTRNSLDAKPENSGVRISISSRVCHLCRGFNTASGSERLGNGLVSAYERLASIELTRRSTLPCFVCTFPSLLCTWLPTQLITGALPPTFHSAWFPDLPHCLLLLAYWS